MKKLFATLALVLTPALALPEDARQAPQVVLKSADGKTEVDLAKLTSEGPVLVRLTCACVGCDAEVAQFQKLQSAYNGKGLKTVAVFREKPEAASNYAVKKGLSFIWLSDPRGELWKTFDAKAMPTNILIAQGGQVVKVMPGCTPNGKNAQALSAEIAKLLGVPEVSVAESKPKKQ